MRSLFVSGLILTLVTTVALTGCTLGRDVNVKAFQTPSTSLNITETTTESHTYTYKIKTNYKIIETISSNIGATMIKVEDTVVEDMETNLVRDIVEDTTISNNDKHDLDSYSTFKTLNDIEISGEFKTKKLLSGKMKTAKYDADYVFKVVGTLNIDGNNYYVIDMDKLAYKFLVTKDGYFVADKFLDLDKDSDDKHYHYTSIQLKTTPEKIKFDMSAQTNQEKARQEKQHNKRQIVDKNRYSPVINYELIYGGKEIT